MEKKKILHVIGGMNRCGAETFLMNVFRNIDREKFDFYFLCYDENTYEYEEEIKQLGGIILRIPQLKKSGTKKFIKNLTKIIKDYKIDVIHTHTYYNSAIPLLVAKHNKIGIRIVHSHSTMSEYKSSLIKKVYNLLSKIIIERCANIFLACSDEAGKSLFFKNRKFAIIKNGIDLEKFKINKEKRIEFRKKMNIEENEILIGHIGRFEEEKNHQFLINTFNEILKINNKYKLILLGNGSKFKQIKNMCKEYKIENKVIFLGNVSNVSEIINAFDLFVFPSLFEGLGIVLIEAQANGIKCFASTEVPNEANIFDNIEYLELSEGVNKWAEEIINSDTARKEIDISNCEYDIKNTVKQLTIVYNSKERKETNKDEQ